MLRMAISIFVEQGNREHFIFVRIIGLHKSVLPNTRDENGSDTDGYH
jgi:hypothetical protein